MDEELLSFKQTKERQAIVAAFDAAQASLQRAAEQLRLIGYKGRAHETLNIAQSCASKKSLLAQDWSLEDQEAA